MINTEVRLHADDLEMLDKQGVEVYDGYRKENVRIFVKLLGVLTDMRAHQKLLAVGGTPAKFGCIKCWSWGGQR